MEYITASCVIEQGRVYRNGSLLFAAAALATPAPAASAAAAASPTDSAARIRASPADPTVPTDSDALTARALAPGASPTAPADFLAAAYRHFDLQYPKFYKMDLLSRLGWIATELLLGPGWDTTIYRPEDIAVVLSNANSSLDTDYKYHETTRDIPSPSVFVYTLPNIVTGEICIRHALKGENAFFLSSSFDPVLLANYCGYLLEQGIANACITGWVDLLGDEYKAALFLIERTIHPEAPEFSAETMQAIFQNPAKQ
jgi:hypothetical protein